MHALIVLYSYATRDIKNARHMTLYCVVEHDCPSTIGLRIFSSVVNSKYAMSQLASTAAFSCTIAYAS